VAPIAIDGIVFAISEVSKHPQRCLRCAAANHTQQGLHGLTQRTVEQNELQRMATERQDRVGHAGRMSDDHARMDELAKHRHRLAGTWVSQQREQDDGLDRDQVRNTRTASATTPAC